MKTANKPLTYIKAAKEDVLGDRWARRVSQLYEQALEREGIEPIGDGMGAVWQLFQWMYCEMAGMKHRVIASPRSMIAAGWPIENKHVEMAERLMRAQSDILEDA